MRSPGHPLAVVGRATVTVAVTGTLVLGLAARIPSMRTLPARSTLLPRDGIAPTRAERVRRQCGHAAACLRSALLRRLQRAYQHVVRFGQTAGNLVEVGLGELLVVIEVG
ncbi:hypothetical protein I552_0419 [Mycobacterium xenopi 3993]|nr:hypothetical protein I552_0419 [Mycobacterium xenopi 3993]